MNKLKMIILIPVAVLALLLMSSCGSKNPENSSYTASKISDWHITQSATCTKSGIEARTLANGETETRTVPATGHQIVTDQAVDPTCTEDGHTEGSHCSVCGEIIVKQEVIPARHTLRILPGVAPDCTRAGRTAGTVCTVCGETVEVQKKIRPLNHHYVDGVCTNCHRTKPDKAAALLFDQFVEDSPANFITASMYPGGSVVSFRAFVPEESSWWAICYTTDANDAGLYKWSENSAAGQTMTSFKGKWADYSVTLPDDGKQYYIYFAGAKSEWQGNALLVDDLKITSKTGEILAQDGFDDGFKAGIFNVVATNAYNGKAAVVEEIACDGHTSVIISQVDASCTEDGMTESTYCEKCGKILVEAKTIKAAGHDYDENYVCRKCGQSYQNIAAKIYIANLNEGKKTNFITGKAYKGGSTVSFKVKIPEGVDSSWFGVSWSTDANNTDIYNAASIETGYPISTTVADKWITVTFKLPNDGKAYYVYIGGPKDAVWKEKYILIDDFKVTAADGTVSDYCDFDQGLSNSIFKVAEKNAQDESVAVATEVWENGHTIVLDSGVPATCTREGKTEGSHCAVCGKVLKEQTVIPALNPTGGHDYDENGICTMCHQPYRNLAAEIFIKNLNEFSDTNFITKKAYKGGSTVSVKVKVPAGITWWGFSWTTDPTDIDVYRAASASTGKPLYSTNGEWVTVSFTLPDDGKDYYIYVGGPHDSQWNGKSVLIDDIRITDKAGNRIDSCDFDEGLENSIFSVNDKNTYDDTVVDEFVIENGHTVVVDAGIIATCTREGKTEGSHCAVCGKILKEQAIIPALRPDIGHTFVDGVCSYCGYVHEDLAVAIDVGKLYESQQSNLITSKAYDGGTVFTFDAFVPEGLPSTWWGVVLTTDKSSIDIYKAAVTTATSKQMMTTANIGKWATYSITLPNDGKKYYIYFAAPAGNEWKGKYLLIDNVMISKDSVTVDSCKFDDGISVSEVTDVFTIIEKNSSDQPVISSVPHDYYCKI